MDLVVISLEVWDAVWRRNQHLVAGLLRRDESLRVLFVEPASDPLHTLLRRQRPQLGRGLRRGPEVSGVASGKLWLLEPTKVLPRKLDRKVDERWAKAVAKTANSLGMTSPVLWVNDPTGARLVDSLGAAGHRAVYDITDDWTLADRTPDQLRRTIDDENDLLARAAEVVVCSPELARTKGDHRRVAQIPNGVDLKAYSGAHARPDDLPTGHVALYVGTLHEDRLDVDATVATAHLLHDDEHLVLVGPNALAPAATARLQAAGVLLLGPRPSDSVPSYLLAADLLIVPHVVTRFTDSLDPIKLYEYQAAGRPVVSTRVAGFRHVDDEQLTLADAAEFPSAVALALRQSGDRAPAPGHGQERTSGIDWSDRVAQMQAVLARLDGHP